MPEGAGFCPACGGKNQGPADTPAENEPPMQSNPTEQPTPYQAAQPYRAAGDPIRQGRPPVGQPIPYQAGQSYQPTEYPANQVRQPSGYPVPQPYGQTPYQSGAGQSNPNRKRLIIIIAVAAALLIAAGILLAVLLSGGKTADISGTWEGTISLDASDGDPELRDTDLDLIGRTANVTVVFDMDDDAEGLAELYIDDDPDQLVKLDAAVKGKTVTLSGRMFGNETELSGKIIEPNDDRELFAEGTLTGRNGSMTIELDIEQTSSRKNRPEGSGDGRPTEETTESTEPFTSETTETEPTTTVPAETKIGRASCRGRV